MDPLPLGTLADLLGGTPSGRFDAAATAEHATIHSERIRRGSAFFALAGSRTDGHRFAAGALANGAAVAVVAAGRAPAGAGPCIEVDDPLAALHRLASWWRGRLAAQVIAVVGSNGKTVTKDAIVHFAGYGRVVYGSPGSYNSQIGVPLAVLDCPADCELAVIEAAVSDPGEMARLRAILRPDCVVLTNLGARWGSRSRDRSHRAAELTEMAADLGDSGWLLVGGDAPELEAAVRPGGRRLVTNTSPGLPRFGIPQAQPDGLAVAVESPGGPASTVTIKTPSEEILADVETAITVAWLVGVGGTDLLAAASEYSPTSTRMEIWKSPGGVTMVRDVASPDPIAVGSAVRSARRLCGPDDRCLVVLAEPLDHPSPASAAAFAAAVVAEGAAGVYGLDLPSHRQIAAVAPTGAVPFRLAPDVAGLRTLLLGELGPGDVVLVQSAPSAAISDLAVALMESMAPTRVYLDLGAIEDNVTAFRRLVGPSVRIMGMVKALAYGTDAPNISVCLQGAGVDALGVSGVDEGITLRRAGVGVPILVLLATAGEAAKMLRYRLTPVLYAPAMLESVVAEAAGHGGELPVHLEVDSGMHRTGFEPAAAVAALERLAATPGLRVAGLMTHLASADDPAEDGATREQLRRFRAVSEAVDRLGLTDVLRHAAATAGTIRLPESHFDMVRVGLGLYGVHLAPEMAEQVELQQAIGFVSRIVEVLDVPAGERVGYGGTFTAPAGGARVGVVPAGYHDGVPRSASNAASVVVAGVRCGVVGRISMDSMTVDLSSCPGGRVGSDVLVYGRRHDWSLPVEELAASSGTISHEVMARIGPRVQRIFTRH